MDAFNNLSAWDWDFLTETDQKEVGRLCHSKCLHDYAIKDSGPIVSLSYDLIECMDRCKNVHSTIRSKIFLET